MTTPKDTAMLDAYVDGTLTPEEAARVETRLAASPEDRAYVARLEDMNRLLAAAFAAPLREPVPETIRRMIADGAASRAPSAAPRRGWTWSWPWPALAGGGAALAAALALALVLAPGRDGAPLLLGVQPGPVALDSALHELFDGAPSGRSAEVPRTGEVTMVASFRDGAGRPCREFDAVAVDAGSLTRGLACRDGAQWSVEVAIAAPLALPEARAEFVPASGTGDAALGGALDALDAGMVLSPAEEADLIAGGWQD